MLRLPERVTVKCLGCNYPLNDLPSPRCPECGRGFDREDRATFNTGRPLNWLDRKLLAPIGPVTFATVAIPCTVMLYLSLSSDIYYMGVHLVMLTFTCGAVAAVVAVRLALREIIPPVTVPRPRDRRRVLAVVAATAITCLLVVGQVPLRVAFLFARPRLDRLVADVRAGRVTEPVPPRRAGPFVVESSSNYGGDDTLFFHYAILGQSGGLAHCPTNGPRGYYNTGTDGPLGWNWHWWTDD